MPTSPRMLTAASAAYVVTPAGELRLNSTDAMSEDLTVLLCIIYAFSVIDQRRVTMSMLNAEFLEDFFRISRERDDQDVRVYRNIHGLLRDAQDAGLLALDLAPESSALKELRPALKKLRAASKVAPQQVAPPQAAPQQVAPPQAAPQQVAPPQAAPQQVAPPQAAPQQVAPPQAAPGKKKSAYRFSGDAYGPLYYHEPSKTRITLA
jgi:hypothetical protein